MSSRFAVEVDCCKLDICGCVGVLTKTPEPRCSMHADELCSPVTGHTVRKFDVRFYGREVAFVVENGEVCGNC